jgi:hypothetical protein
MDGLKYHIVYANRKVEKDRTLRATDGAVDAQDIGDVGDDLSALLSYGDGELQ